LLGTPGDEIDERGGEREHGDGKNDRHPSDGDGVGRRTGVPRTSLLGK
jgi:hypothetical protein